MLFFIAGAFILIILLIYIISNNESKQKEEAAKVKKEKYNKKIHEINNTVNKHIEVLARKKHQLISVNDYGVINDKEWRKEINSFIESTLSALKNSNIISEYHLIGVIDRLVTEYQNTNKDKLYLDFNKEMTGIEYEHYCADLLEKKGWITQVTQGSGDQGVDVIAKKDNKTIVIQCKKYNSPVGNKAVQEAHAGKGYIKANGAAVVTNSTFTSSAKELSRTLGILLLHHEDIEMINEL